MNAHPLLSVDGASVTFGTFPALSDIRFDVAEGELVALIGPNGAGKTTILNLLSGELSPTTGAVSFRGQSLAGLKPHQVPRRGLARTFQAAEPFQHLTVRENVMVGGVPASGLGLIAGLGFRADMLPCARRLRAEADGHLDRVGLLDKADAQAVVVWAPGPGQAIAVKNFRQLGMDLPLYLSHAANDFNFLRLAGSAADGIFIPSSKIYVTDALSASDPQKAVIETFVKDYEAKYGKPPATFAGNAYDAVMMLAAAVGKSGAGDHVAIRDAVEGLKDHVGVTAVYSYGSGDHFGAKADSVVMLTVKDGKFTLAH